MNTYKISNIPLRKYKRFLIEMGLTHERTKGGHESWHKEGLGRNVTLPSHIDTVKPSVIEENNETLGLTKKQFIELFYKLK